MIQQGNVRDIGIKPVNKPSVNSKSLIKIREIPRKMTREEAIVLFLFSGIIFLIAAELISQQGWPEPWVLIRFILNLAGLFSFIAIAAIFAEIRKK